MRNHRLGILQSETNIQNIQNRYPQDHGCAPNVCNAALNSLTAVSASSKFKAEMAHLACFCALAIAISSVLSGVFRLAGGACTGAGGGIYCCCGG